MEILEEARLLFMAVTILKITSMRLVIRPQN